MPKKHKDPTLSAFNNLYSLLRISALNRGIPWHLDHNQLRQLSKGNCTYCGREPFQVKSHRGSKYIYNGIDRVDNFIGYEAFNCVSCCGFCNRMKNTYTKEEFLNQIKRIYFFQQGIV